MYFESLSAGEPHEQWDAPRPLPGSPRINEPLGGSLRAESQLFRLLDLVSYLHTRRGIVTRAEIQEAVPGWAERTDASERLYFRTMTTLQTTFGMTIATVSDAGEPAAYQLRNRFGSPLLAYASGRGPAPAVLTAVPERNWNTHDCVHAVCGILRTLACTPRDVLLRPEDPQAQWPLTSQLLLQFLRRWTGREDFRRDQPRALRLLWCDSRFRLSTRWPVAPSALHMPSATPIREEAA